MKAKSATVIFVDHNIVEISRAVLLLKESFRNLLVMETEDALMEFLEKNEADVIMISLDLLPNDGISLMKEIRALDKKNAPFIIIYSDKQDDFLQEAAYDAGADSFIDFHRDGTVMTLYLKNILQRRVLRKKFNQRSILIDKEKYLVYHNGLPVQLPKKEFSLFEMLYNNADKCLSKREIAAVLWQDESVSKKRIIDVHIYNLRKFFGKKTICTSKGNGYKYVAAKK
jgi:DNA-binding response OmpR family regulator